MTGETLDLIRKTIGEAIPQAGLTRGASLIKVSAGTRTAGSLTKGTNPTEVPFRCQALYDDQSLTRFPESRVQKGDRAVLFIADTIAGGQFPEPGDKVTLEGETTTIDSVLERDPAAATYLCLTRKT